MWLHTLQRGCFPYMYIGGGVCSSSVPVCSGWPWSQWTISSSSGSSLVSAIALVIPLQYTIFQSWITVSPELSDTGGLPCHCQGLWSIIYFVSQQVVVELVLPSDSPSKLLALVSFFESAIECGCNAVKLPNVLSMRRAPPSSYLAPPLSSIGMFGPCW